MNIEEWTTLKNSHIGLVDWSFYNSTRSIQKSLKYNSDPNAKVIHHLRDTEEQRKYNDEHYELWGHNLDGSFEYGKYVIFVTQEQHSQIHMCSEETNKKISQKVKDSITPERRKKMSEVAKSLWMDEEYRDKVLTTTHSEEYRKRASDITKASMSEERKRQLSEISKALWQDEEYISKTTEAMKLSWSDERRARQSEISKSRVFSDEARKRMSESQRNRVMSEEELKARSERAKRLWQDEETRNRIITSTHTEEANKKRSNTCKQLWQNDEYVNKVMSNKKPLSEETKKKIRESQEQYWTEEKRAERSAFYKSRIESVRLAFSDHKLNGGTMSWNEFQKFYSLHNK